MVNFPYALSPEQKEHIQVAFTEAVKTGTREYAFNYLYGWFSGWTGENLANFPTDLFDETR